ncbi:MAG: GNAT family N-acetyltransferase [Alphaproteobacteria bacterium]
MSVIAAAGAMQQQLKPINSPTTAARTVAGVSSADTRLDDIALSVHSDIASIEHIWRKLESVASASIYQRFDWIFAWCAHAAPALGIEPAVVIGHRGDEPVFLLPLGRQRRGFGIEIAWLGCSHSNIGMGLFEPGFAAGLSGKATDQLFAQIVKFLKPADVIALRNQPFRWADADNPFGLLSYKVVDQPVLAIHLSDDFGSMLNARKRKKLRWQENALEASGGYRFFQARDRVEMNAVFDEFLSQKDHQFAKLGIDNVFAGPGPVDFFRALIDQSINTDNPLIQLYGIEIAGEIKATFAGGVFQNRLYGYFNGITVDEFQRVSPGELLLYHLVKHCCAERRSVLDLGVGEERYKASWSPDREQQFATYAPASVKGQLLTRAMKLTHLTKSWVRRNETAWKAARRVRRLRAAVLHKTNR